MTQSSLLMIRPQEAAQSFVRALSQTLDRPLAVVYSPVMSIEAVAAHIDLDGVTHLVFTSANGVKQFAALTYDRSIQALCVGKTTQQAALKIGLKATPTGRTVADLLMWLKNRNPGPELNILYLRGDQVSFDLLPALCKSGIQISEVVLYRQKHQSLSETAVRLLQEKPVVIPVFSANSATGLLKTGALSDACQASLVCISPNVAHRFKGLCPNRIAIAKTPDRSGMIAAVAELL
jgi:uroporphyrinogen-III synthase